jgi:ribosomal protein L30E
MLSENQIRKLDSYFGFALRKRAIYVGMKMEEMLARKRLDFVLVLPSCSEKKELDLSHYKKDNPNLVIYRYEGTSYDVKSVLGFELLNAVGIKDPHLSKAIQSILMEDK